MNNEVGTVARDCSQSGLPGSGPGITGRRDFCEMGPTSQEEKAGAIHETQVCFGMVRKMKFSKITDRFADLVQQLADICITQFRRDLFSATSLVPAVLDGENVKRSNEGLRIGVISEDVAQVLQCLDEIQAFCQFVPEPLATIRRSTKIAPVPRATDFGPQCQHIWKTGFI